jgi:DNA-binding winged helix-turn-helix (wHTH) protein/Tol biopolymer transport system component
MTERKCFVFRFADVEVRERQFRVTRAGKSLAIEPKAFRVLLYLVQNPSRVISKNEFLEAVWGDITVTENSLSREITSLRRLLGDDARDPHLIETVSTVGYRFICPVESAEDFGHSEPGIPVAQANAIAAGLTSVEKVAAVSERPAVGMKNMPWAILGASALILLLVLGTGWFLRRPLPTLRIASIARITTDAQIKRVAGTGGSDVYLNLFVPNGHGTVPISGGRVTPLSIDLPTSQDVPNDNLQILSVSSDGSRLLIGSNWSLSSGRDLWIVNNHGGEARYLAKGFWATWSPDGGTVLYSTLHGDLYTIPGEGGEPRLLLASTVPPRKVLAVTNLAWSPDGRKIRFVRDDRYWEVSGEGRNPHEVLPDWRASNPKYFMSAGHWTPDGDFFLFTAGTGCSQDVGAGTQLWALDERGGGLHAFTPQPFQLTTGTMTWGAVGVSMSRDGRTVFALGIAPHGGLVRYDPGLKRLVPYLEGIPAAEVAFSRDGKYMAYGAWPPGTMWRANRDGSARSLLLNNPRLAPVAPEWSPDGKQILFFDWSPCERGVMYTVSSQGGTPKRLLPGDKDWEISPSWSPDGKKVVFEQLPAGAAAPVSGIEFNIGASNKILEIDTGKVTDLPPCPSSCFNPRWSPDERYILTMTDDNDLALFDLRTNKWSLFNLHRDAMNSPRWSHDGRFIYFGDFDYIGGLFKSREPGIYRVPVSGGTVEKVVDLTGFSTGGNMGGWLGLDPSNNPLLFRQDSIADIYALSLERK